MTRRLISTGSPFEAAYGYSRAVVQPPFVFVAGTTGYDYTTMTMPVGVAAQARNAFATIARVLEEAGSSLSDVVQARYYVVDPADQVPFLKVVGEVMGDIRPAATIVVVAGLLEPAMRVEIEVVAMRRDHSDLP